MYIVYNFLNGVCVIGSSSLSHKWIRIVLKYYYFVFFCHRLTVYKYSILVNKLCFSQSWTRKNFMTVWPSFASVFVRRLTFIRNVILVQRNTVSIRKISCDGTTWVFGRKKIIPSKMNANVFENSKVVLHHACPFFLLRAAPPGCHLSRMKF